MAKFTQTYPADPKYTEWQQIEQYFPPHKLGRPRKWNMWLIVNAIFYVTRTGCRWPLRVMPKDLPPWQMVYGYFGPCKRTGAYEQINATLAKQARQQAGHESKPSAASIDSQSAKPPKAVRRAVRTCTNKLKAANGTLWSISWVSC